MRREEAGLYSMHPLQEDVCWLSAASKIVMVLSRRQGSTSTNECRYRR